MKEGRKKEQKSKGWNEEGIEKERNTERKKEFRGKGKKKSSAGFKPVRLVLLDFLPVKREGVCGGIRFTFLFS